MKIGSHLRSTESLGSEVTALLIVYYRNYYFGGWRKGWIYINFLFERKWRSTTWVYNVSKSSYFYHFCWIRQLENGRGKANFQVFAIQKSCDIQRFAWIKLLLIFLETKYWICVLSNSSPTRVEWHSGLRPCIQNQKVPVQTTQCVWPGSGTHAMSLLVAFGLSMQHNEWLLSGKRASHCQCPKVDVGATKWMIKNVLTIKL